MLQTAVDLNPGRIVALALSGIDAVLQVAGTHVDGGALGEVVLVAGTDHEALEVLIDITRGDIFIVGGGIQVAEGGLDLAVADRNVHAEHHGPAVGVAIAFGLAEVAEAAPVAVIAACADSLGVVEPVHAEVGLGKAAVVVDGSRDGDLVVFGVKGIVGAEAGLVQHVDSAVQAQTAVVVGHGSGVVAVARGFVFVGLVFFVTHAVQHPDFSAGEVRGLVVNHVVHTGRTIGLHVALNADVTPARTEGGEVAAQTGRAGIVGERAQTAHTELTEAAFDVDARFTVKESVVAHGAGVGVKAVFEDEADRQAVAEFLDALEAEAGAGALTGHHAEAVVGIVGQSGVVVVVVGVVGKAGIDDTVQRHGRCGGAAHCRGSSQTNQSLFHD